jgi:hypothetical protein
MLERLEDFGWTAINRSGVTTLHCPELRFLLEKARAQVKDHSVLVAWREIVRKGRNQHDAQHHLRVSDDADDLGQILQQS